MGWFKSEPLGLFYGFLAVYLLLSGITSQNKKIAFAKLAGAGIVTTFALSAWGGNQFFIIPVGLFFLALPFIRTDHRFIIWAVPLYTAVTAVTSLGFEGVAASFLFGLGGVALIVPTVFLVACILIQKKSARHKMRNGLIFLLALMVVAPTILVLNSDLQVLPIPSFRYQNALNPFLTSTDPLVDSVSEHATTTLEQSFLFHSVLMLFAGVGIWLIIKNAQSKDDRFLKTDMLAFTLILGMVGVYVSSAFIRLEVFAAVSIIVLASLGLGILTRMSFKTHAIDPMLSQKKGRIKRHLQSRAGSSMGVLFKIPYLAGIVILLVVPLAYPAESNIFTLSDSPPTILTGGTGFNVVTSDWLESLEWIKNNTPEDAVIASWWDYGYWISTMGERASVADNFTVSTNIIANIARTLLSSPDDAWNSLNEMEADYVLVFVSGQRLTSDTGQPLYLLHGGGDESKKQWFMRIAGDDVTKYVHSDGVSGTDFFWNETLLGQTFPFTPITYINFELNQESSVYRPGFQPVYIADIKYPAEGDGPLRMVYASPSFTSQEGGPVLGIFIYEVNKDYAPADSG